MVSDLEADSMPLAPAMDDASADMSEIAKAELVLLRARVIALEHVLIAVLAEGSDRQRQATLDVADTITPNPVRHSMP